MNSGDRMLLFSDGVLDAESSHGGRFGTNRLVECACGEFPSVRELVRAIDDRIITWCHGRHEDDISLLAIGLSRRQ
jgi:serine phosphatase RsbU (regulator of sigma subunit)